MIDPKKFKYKVGEDIYNIPEDQLEDFKLEFPDAKEFMEAAKENGVIGTGASVTPGQNMASSLDPGSLDSIDPKDLYKDYSNAITISEEEEENLNKPIDFTPQGTSAELQPYNPETQNDLVKSAMEKNYRDPVTGEVFKDNELTYRTQKDKDGNMINQPFVPYIKQLSLAKEMLMDPEKLE